MERLLHAQVIHAKREGGDGTLVPVLELKLDAVGGRHLFEYWLSCTAQVETSPFRRNLQPRWGERQPPGDDLAGADSFQRDPARGVFRIVPERNLSGTRRPLPQHVPVQGVLGVGRVQGRSLGIKLVGLEAIPGALGALSSPKKPSGLVFGPEDRPKSQQNQSNAGYSHR